MLKATDLKSGIKHTTTTKKITMPPKDTEEQDLIKHLLLFPKQQECRISLGFDNVIISMSLKKP